MFFFAKSGYENFIGVDVKTLCEELGMSKPTVCDGLKALEEKATLNQVSKPTIKQNNQKPVKKPSNVMATISLVTAIIGLIIRRTGPLG